MMELRSLAMAALQWLLCSAGHDQVQKVTLIPRGQAKGLTWFIPGEDPSLLSKQQIFARIVSALGGRAAEEVIFGDPEVTTGASGDLQQVHSCPIPAVLHVLAVPLTLSASTGFGTCTSDVQQGSICLPSAVFSSSSAHRADACPRLLTMHIHNDLVHACR